MGNVINLYQTILGWLKCCGITHRTFNAIKRSKEQWHRETCFILLSNTNTRLNACPTEDDGNASKSNTKEAVSCEKGKCGHCRKFMPEILRVINCDTCRTTQKAFHNLKMRNELWCCKKYSSKLLPFSNIDNNELYLEMQATPIPSSDIVQGMPSFTIQSLLDEMPGQNYETDEFMSESKTSKYFTPSQFLESKLPKNMFSMIHINIASLSKHIEELRICFL